MSYLPSVAWSTIPYDIELVDPLIYNVTVVPIDPNEPGGEFGEKSIGFYLKDNVGHIYSIVAINIDGNADRIQVSDDLNTGVGPQSGQHAFVYKSVGDGDAPYLAPIRHIRLDKSALDYSRAIELDVIWKNKEPIILNKTNGYLYWEYSNNQWIFKDEEYSLIDHKHYQLYQPDDTTPFVYTDNGRTLHIDGNIVQNGSVYETHAEQVYTKDDKIILRDGAVAGLSPGQYTGFVAKLYDGSSDGQLVFDNTGIARVGDVGSEQPLTTRIEFPSNGQFAYWENSNTRLNFKYLDTSDVAEHSSRLYFTDERAQDAVGSILLDSGSIDFTYTDAANQITASVIPGGVDHNSLLNFVSNKHIDHSLVSITGGNGLTGGGDITSSRTISHSMGSWVSKTTLSGPDVISNLSLDSYGHLTDWSTRSLNIDNLSDVIITSPQVDQILRWNGSAFVNGQETTVNGGSGVDYFFVESSSDISGYSQLNKSPDTGSELDEIVVSNNNRVLFQEYASPSIGIGGSKIDAGIWTFDIWGYVDISLSGSSSIDVEIYKRTSGGLETLLFTINTGSLLTSLGTLPYVISTVQPEFLINPTDRIVAKVYGKNTASVNRTIHFFHGGVQHYSHFNTPLVTRHNDLSGLNEGEYKHLSSSQYAIASQPASSTLSGYLTNSDWVIFNNKQSALSGTGIVKSTSGVISYITDNSVNWNTAYNWGDHSLVGYWKASNHPTTLSGYGITDTPWIDYVPQSGYTFGAAFSMGTMYVGTGEQYTPSYILGVYSNGYAYKFPLAGIQSWLGLGSMAYETAINYAPASGSTNYIQNQNSSAQSANMWISGGIVSNSNIVSNLVSDIVLNGSFNTPSFAIRESSNSDFIIDRYDRIHYTSTPTLTLSNNGGAATFASTISATGGNSTQWNSAYSWGNHAGLYLPLSAGASYPLTGSLWINNDDHNLSLNNSAGGWYTGIDFYNAGTIKAQLYHYNPTNHIISSNVFEAPGGNSTQWNSAYTGLNASGLTTNSLIKWDGSKNVNSKFYDDGNAHVIGGLFVNNTVDNISNLFWGTYANPTTSYTYIVGDGRSTGFLKFYTNDTQNATLFANGNFHVGYTTDQGYKFAVNGNAYVGGTGTFTGALDLKTYGQINLYNGNNTNHSFISNGTTGGNILALSTTGGNDLLINATGNATFGGSVTATGSFIANGYSGIGNSFSSSGNDIYIETGAAGRNMYFRPNGTGNDFGLFTISTTGITTTGGGTFGGNISIGSPITILGSSYTQTINSNPLVGSTLFGLQTSRSANGNGALYRPDVWAISNSANNPKSYGLLLGRSIGITDIIIGNGTITSTDDAANGGNGTGIPSNPYIRLVGFGAGYLTTNASGELSVSTSAPNTFSTLWVGYPGDPSTGNVFAVNGNAYFNNNVNIGVGCYVSGGLTCNDLYSVTTIHAAGDMTSEGYLSATYDASIGGDVYARGVMLTSDIRKKENVEDISNINRFSTIKSFKFNYKNDKNNIYYMPMAQDIESVAPELVRNINGEKKVNIISYLCAKISYLENQLDKLINCEINKN